MALSSPVRPKAKLVPMAPKVSAANAAPPSLLHAATSPWVSPRYSASSGALSTLCQKPVTPSSRGRASKSANWRSKSCPTASASPGSMGNWRTNPGPSPPPPGPEFLVGRVVELPEEASVPATSIAYQEVSGHPWKHPAVITKTWEDNGVKLVRIRNCTSFGGNGLKPKSEHHRQFFVEADESQLEEGSGEFEKPTWVNCSRDHELTIEFQYLRRWLVKGKAIQFSQSALDSFNKNERVRRDSLF